MTTAKNIKKVVIDKMISRGLLLGGGEMKMSRMSMIRDRSRSRSVKSAGRSSSWRAKL
jgi:hypothetical protein